jgi:uncharacterized protein YprB with RNaseH-like and TPR domain
MESLAELRRVLRVAGDRPPPPRRPPSLRSASLETLTGGTVQETQNGSIFAIAREFPAEHSHGRVPLRLALDSPPDAFRVITGRPDAPALSGERLLYLDVETTGLAGGTGTYAFLVGVGFFRQGRFAVRQYFMRDLDEEPALLASVAALLPSFDAVVTYNGRGFDIPLLETRFILGRLPWPQHLWQLDFLSFARRLWRHRLPDCRLPTIEASILGVERRNDIPGGLIPSLYFDYLRRRHPGELPRVFAHNQDDLLSLAALVGWSATALLRVGALTPEEQIGLGRLWEPLDWERARCCYEMALPSLRGEASRPIMLLLASRYKRRAEWQAARRLWEDALETEGRFDPRAWEELAKFYEHRARDLPKAREVTVTALARAERGERVGEETLAPLRHRLRRLERRLSRRAPGPAAGGVLPLSGGR